MDQNKKEKVILSILDRNPEYSKYRNCEFLEKIEDEIKKIKQNSPDTKLVIAGVWNARTGTEEDYFNSEEIGEDERWRRIMCSRRNQNTVVNNAGQKLLRMCKRL